MFTATCRTSAGRIVTVKEPINSVYRLNGGPSGRLGLPLNDEFSVLANGRRRQQFQGGSFEYGVGETPVLRNAVFAVTLTSAGSLRLNLNDTFEVGPDGDDHWRERDRSRRVVDDVEFAGDQIAIAPNQTGRATLRAGGGKASITATSEGKASPPLTVFVSAPCCVAGEGAPTAALQQIFPGCGDTQPAQSEAASASPVQRFGAGYLQDFVAADSGARFVLAKPDLGSLAYVLTGGLLDGLRSRRRARGPLGYPSSDPSATGRQLFENAAALAGDPCGWGAVGALGATGL